MDFGCVNHDVFNKRICKADAEGKWRGSAGS